MKTKEEVSKVLKKIARKMTRDAWICFFFRKNPRFTEKYYFWLLPDVTVIDCEISGFELAWKNNRRNFDGMLGLVRAAKEVFPVPKSQKRKIGTNTNNN